MNNPPPFADQTDNSTNTRPLLRLEDVSVVFEAGTSQEKVALCSASLTINEGEFISLLGVSGCGKTTTLNALAGHITPTRGRVFFDEKPHVGPSPDLGVVFQTSTLFPWLTVTENLQVGCRMQALPKAERDTESADLLTTLGIADVGGFYPHQLSGGMARRVEVARAIANRPRVLLLDEPFGGLDAINRIIVQDWFAEVWKRFSITTVLVTHAVDEAFYFSDRVVIMSPSPGTVHRIVPVPYPRPRTREIFSTAEFDSLRSELKTMLMPDNTIPRRARERG
jgi:NitT/TauT family transport system ATP-binding protein